MANNVFRVKRTSTSGRTPNTTGTYATNSQYIAAGEFALNMADGILYSSNGSAVIEVGGNTTTQRITTALILNNDKRLNFNTVNTSVSAYFIQQNDDNFVFYTTNTAYGARPVWSIYANSIISNLQIQIPLQLNSGLVANGGLGSAGQALLTNGTATYWATPSVSATVNTAAQFSWSNLHTFSANVSFTGNGIGIATNTGAIYLGGLADNNWKIGRNTGATTKWRYTNNSIDIITANSNLEGFSIGLISNASYFETGYLGTFIASNLTIGSASSNSTINSTAFSGTAANATLLNNKTEGNLNVNSALYANASISNTFTVGTGSYFVSNGNVGISNATPNAKLAVTGTANISGNFTVGGITTFNANVILGSSGLSANGGFGTAGHVLHSNGTATYWAADDNSGGTVTSVASGNGIIGGTITATGTLYVDGANGISVDASGVNVLVGNTQLVSNATGVWITQSQIDHNSLSNYAADRHIAHSTVAITAGNGLTGGGNIDASRTLDVGAGNGITVAADSVSVNGGSTLTVNSAGAHVNTNLTLTTLVTTGNVVLGVANAGIVANSTGITTSTNTTVNSNLTAALLRIANSTGSANLTATSLVIGATTIQTTNVILGGTVAANGGIGTAGQVLKSGGAGANAYWAADLNSGGTVTSVASGNGLTGGPITATGTLSVVAGTGGGLVSNSTGVFVTQGTGTVVNATGVHVNSTYIGTLSSNNASFLGGTAAASYVQNTDSRTLSGNLVISGTSFTPSSNTILLGNSTQRWVLSANTGSFSGAVSGITTLAAGNTTITGFANVTSTIQGGSSLTIAGALSGVTTAAMGNTTITGFANVSTSVNSALLTVGTTFIANTTQLTTTVPFSANGGTGTSGQVLTSNGATGSPYWTAAAGGGYYKGGSAAVGSLAVGGQNLFRVNANTLNTNTTFVSGENGTATGPISIASGITLTIQSGARVSIV